ncbi:hypothetical protein KY320_03980 [Candidatus Woesearchaeota archaeon]|nr:hypothetical protein [Candidatus Woesearchaeota archaeon]
MGKSMSLARAKRLLKVVGGKDSFWLCTNEDLRSLNTLAQALERVDDDVFRYHVNKYKNDFSDWVKDKIGDNDFAREISRIKTKDTLVRKLNEKVDESRELVKKYRVAAAKRKRTIRKKPKKRVRKPVKRRSKPKKKPKKTRRKTKKRAVKRRPSKRKRSAAKTKKAKQSRPRKTTKARRKTKKRVVRKAQRRGKAQKRPKRKRVRKR